MDNRTSKQNYYLDIADAVLDEYESIFKVEITLKKPNAPIKADFDYVGVTIVRER